MCTLDLRASVISMFNRLEVHQGGQLVYSHERDESWSVSAYLTSLQHQHGLSPRDIYWRYNVLHFMIYRKTL